MLYLALGCRVALILVFGVAVAGKLRAYPAFVASVRAMRLLPANWSPAVAPLAVAAEIAVTVLLLVGRPTGLAFGAATALLLALTGAVVVVLARRTTASCLCFGRTEQPMGPRHLVRNALLLILAVAGAVAGRSAADGATHPAGVALALVAAGVVALLVTTADDLVSLFSPLPKSGVSQ